MSNYIAHSGTPHEGSIPHSGRYAWGTGEHAYQRVNGSLLTTYKKMHKDGISDKDIAKHFGWVNPDGSGNTKVLRAMKRYEDTVARNEERAKVIDLIDKYTKNGKTNISAIGRELGKNESSIRNLLDEEINYNKNVTLRTMDILKKQLETKDYLDVGKGTDAMLNLKNRNILDDALIALEKNEGYHVYQIPSKQMGTHHYTIVRTLAPPKATFDEVYKNKDKIHPVQERVVDSKDRVTSLNIEGYSVVPKSRIMIRYAEEGGKAKDGVIELRPGVPDLSLNKALYAQVRIAADLEGKGKESHYLKGMAIYNDNADKEMPKGVDIIFNTNKSIGTPMEKVLKPLKHEIDPKTGKETSKIDKDNPFGATIKSEKDLKMTQRYYKDPKTGEEKLSAINVVNEQGDWGEWSRTLSSQFLAKQTTELAKRQLDLAYADKKDEFAKIKSLTNATVKKELLKEFADNCDSASVHLKAAALPGQAAHVILPLTKGIKENEIYAPNYDDGTKVVLIRYPHAGRFEIPELTVNNRSKHAKAVIGVNSSDAVGIHASVAERLSGADFDGDSVMVIPTRKPNGHIISDVKTQDPLPGLENFDPHEKYKKVEGMKVISGDMKQKEMGKVSNLITDMTIAGAPPEDLAKAVRHSMVVIDAEKHELNYKLSYTDNDIAELKNRYQNNGNGKHGVSTLISRAKSPVQVELRKKWYASSNSIDPETGEKIYTKDLRNSSYINKKGELVQRHTESTKMAEAKDARELLSGPDHKGTPMERIYASYANDLKKMANEARKEYLKADKDELKKDAAAAKLYKDEVDSLDRKILLARKNAPLERQAQNIANVEVRNKQRDNPNADKELVKKWRNQALAAARANYGAEKHPFVFTDKEWEAVQAGAIGKTKLREIMGYCDKDDLKERAMPKTGGKLSPATVSRIRAYAGSNYTQKQIAQILGVSPTTVSKILNNTYKE